MVMGERRRPCAGLEGGAFEAGAPQRRDAHDPAAALAVGTGMPATEGLHAGGAGRTTLPLARAMPRQVAPPDRLRQRLVVDGGTRRPAARCPPLEQSARRGHRHLRVVGERAAGVAAPRRQAGGPVRPEPAQDLAAAQELQRRAVGVADRQAEQAAAHAVAPGVRLSHWTGPCHALRPSPRSYVRPDEVGARSAWVRSALRSPHRRDGFARARLARARLARARSAQAGPDRARRLSRDRQDVLSGPYGSRRAGVRRA